MTDLTDFLLARIAEDEAVARAASPGPWHPNAERTEVLAVDDITVCDGFALSGPQTRATTDHIARWDPARVLAECEATHEIAMRLRAMEVGVLTRGGLVVAISELRQVCQCLALPYAGHPDYRDEWRP